MSTFQQGFLASTEVTFSMVLSIGMTLVALVVPCHLAYIIFVLEGNPRVYLLIYGFSTQAVKRRTKSGYK